jgi:hypothetical protein
LIEQLEKLDQRMKFRIDERFFLNEISILKPDISILHRTPLLNCPLQSKGQGMEWVRGMGEGRSEWFPPGWLRQRERNGMTRRQACRRVMPLMALVFVRAVSLRLL